MKKGFTLVELLATITLIGILVGLTFPKILEQLDKEKNSVSDSKKQLIYSATKSYMDEHENDYPIRENKVYCIPISTIKENTKLKVDFKDIDNSLVVKVTITDTTNYDLVASKKCTSS